jgi:glycopeptide antibiotics resistance protein
MYLGDALWALMIFFLFGFLFRTKETKWIATLAFLFSYSIEFSQLYHANWIDTLRQTKLGGLVLGYGFLWRDLLSYSIGIGMGILIERTIVFNNKWR